MTLDEAKHIVAHEPWRWRDVWREATAFAAFAGGSVGGPRQRKAAGVTAANLVRLLVPLTGLECVIIAERCSPSGYMCCHGPHGSDVLELYVQAVQLAKGDEWWDHFLAANAEPGDPIDPEWTWLEFSQGQTVHSDGRVECGPVCPPLPEVTL